MSFKKPVLKVAGCYDTLAESRKHQTRSTTPSLTVQSEKDSCDINVIVRNFGVTGLIPQTTRPMLKADFVEVFDFQTAMNTLRSAQEHFMTLPSLVRKRFDNDPQKYLEFVEDPKNVDEMVKLGLAVKAPKEPDPPPPPKAA